MLKRAQSPHLDEVIRREQSPLQKRICGRLEELALTPAEAALAVGASMHLIRDVLRADPRTPPCPATVGSIARALATTSEWLLNGESADPSKGKEDQQIDCALHAKATQAAVQSLETAGLVLDPGSLSELILHLYKRLEAAPQA
ncbi:hypothetical protein [Roseibium polysiphoniae]|uniref:HTH cro/C1-type domain-containing protein n=1 Tax=Roseibium polysiphoniae TaxID=2571221 RepID=A0ABR9C7N3_9HYPH|nr:hypothetical protein [Roseibium polysiphoniae]MBD8875910.1 hypothetical protein [Roseibium polysiphoniae]